jgi:hypothetical protein
VQRASRIFVALTGRRTDRAEECGQYLFWDQAATDSCPPKPGETRTRRKGRT